MILGMSSAAFTQLHVLLSLIGTGAIVVLAMLRGNLVPLWTTLFLLTTLATSVTGFVSHREAVGAVRQFGSPANQPSGRRSRSFKPVSPTIDKRIWCQFRCHFRPRLGSSISKPRRAPLFLFRVPFEQITSSGSFSARSGRSIESTTCATSPASSFSIISMTLFGN
jgi:hypothetical protein